MSIKGWLVVTLDKGTYEVSIRKKKGLNQEELAASLEVSRQTISSLENERYNPSVTLAFKLARFFDMSIEEIFIYEEEEKNEK